MMRFKNLFVVLFILMSLSVRCQTWSEWFRQKKTKLKYITQQISALKVYADFITNANRIVDQGLSFVHDLKHNDYGLHFQHFESLKEVNSSISKYENSLSITAVQTDILNTAEQTRNLIRTGRFQTSEQNYVTLMLNNLLRDCGNNLDEITHLSTEGLLELKDDERLKRINNLNTQMQEMYVFVQHFKKSVQILGILRTKAHNDAGILQLLYNIKK